MKIVAGLGNPGAEYVHTPHNVGFDVVDLLAGRLDGQWRASSRFEARLARVSHAGETFLLVQPQTYMNLSGNSVAPIVRYHGASIDDLVVVLDDADLPAGRLRIRPSGGSGGHRGLASVIESMGSDAFARVRIGIGRGRREGLVNHVLGRFDPETAAVVTRTVEAAADAVLCLAARGTDEAMNRFNAWDAAPPAARPGDSE